ncbi:DUF7109 family protein [Halohasta litorea]|uniref:Uncharacterized protein n=1 Tax=Halohasta litorea TaxID=869891 RepID=A0ABD6DA20_9EURY|nr:hypothetical protein [Halohasta litorea]
MTTTHDELAGVVDLFGALTRSELTAALGELAFKQGQDVDESALRSAIEAAVGTYALVEYETNEGGDDSVEPLIVVGPTAFATLPPNAEDLPHILDFERRTIDRERLAAQVSQRLTSEAEAAVEAGDTERAAELLDVSYDLEAWATVDASGVRSRLEPVLPQD